MQKTQRVALSFVPRCAVWSADGEVRCAAGRCGAGKRAYGLGGSPWGGLLGSTRSGYLMEVGPSSRLGDPQKWDCSLSCACSVLGY